MFKSFMSSNPDHVMYNQHTLGLRISISLFQCLCVVISCLQHKTQDQLVVACRLKCAAGLAEMENKRYKSAARYFIQASIDHCNFPDVRSFTLSIAHKPISMFSQYSSCLHTMLLCTVVYVPWQLMTEKIFTIKSWPAGGLYICRLLSSFFL